MGEIDRPDYDGHLTVDFKNYSFRIQYDSSEHRTGVVVFGCDCAASMTDDEARRVYEAIGHYLRDRENSDAQGDLFEGLLP